MTTETAHKGARDKLVDSIPVMLALQDPRYRHFRVRTAGGDMKLPVSPHYSWDLSSPSRPSTSTRPTSQEGSEAQARVKPACLGRKTR
jgi:hypothetical protein